MSLSRKLPGIRASAKPFVAPFLIASLLFLLGGCNLDPETAKVRFVERGNEYFKNTKYKEASIMYRNALKKDMKYGEAYYRLGLVHKRLGFQVPVKAGDIIQAVNSFRRALEDQRLDKASRVDTMVQLAEIFVWYYTTNPEEQDKEFLNKEVAALRDKFYEMDPNSFDGKRLDGFLALTEGKLDDAITHFEAAMAMRNGEDPGLSLAIMGIKMRQGKAEEAETIANGIIAKDPKYGPAYDALYLHYMVTRRPEMAARILEQRDAAMPGNLAAVMKLTQHYRVFAEPEKREKLMRRIVDNPKEFPDGRESVIRHLFQFAEWDKAIEYAREGIEKDPAKKQTYNNFVAEALLKTGDKAGAEKAVESSLASNSEDAVALALKGQILLDSKDAGKAKLALTDLSKAVAAQPDNVVIRYDLGRAYLASGSMDKAINEFRQAVERRPNYSPAQLALAKLYYLKREYANSIAAADRVLAATQARPSPDAILVKSLAQVGVGDVDKAQALLAKAVELYPNISDLHFELGRIHLAKRQMPQAEASFRKAVEAKPTDFKGITGLAEIYAQQGKIDYAIQYLKDNLATVQTPVLLRNAIGSLYVRKGDLDAALTNYLELSKTVSDSSDLNMRIGEVYRRKGDLQSAVTYMQRSSELDPTNLVPLMQTATILDEMGRTREATAAYQKALQIDSENIVALNNLAYMQAETGGDLDLALRYAETAKRKAPSNIQIDDTLGWIYVKKNLNDNALVIFRDLVKKQPQNATFRYHLGVAYSQRGDTEKAKDELNAALRLNPTTKETEQIRKVLSKL
ncbi:MAG: tetratricopeptide repeat protein [Bryobacterales bacterium]|nr:tetratricopeptide repeat protein [Bryobacterales bacterium]